MKLIGRLIWSICFPRRHKEEKDARNDIKKSSTENLNQSHRPVPNSCALINLILFTYRWNTEFT